MSGCQKVGCKNVKISGAEMSENPKLWVTPFMELDLK